MIFLKEVEYEEIKELTREICGVIKEELSNEGLELYDIKLKFVRVSEDNHIALIDELSGGNMRFYKGKKYSSDNTCGVCNTNYKKLVLI